MTDIELIMTLGLALAVPLVVHACVLHRRLRVQAARIARLDDVMTRLTREQVDTNGCALRLERALTSISERQDSLESRAVSGQRIESALRVARQGAASATLLRELGLSDAEASLLMRLHAIEKAQPQPRSTPGQAATLAQLLARPTASAAVAGQR